MENERVCSLLVSFPVGQSLMRCRHDVKRTFDAVVTDIERLVDEQIKLMTTEGLPPKVTWTPG